MRKVILTGASGFVGGAVLRELLASQYTVYAVVREESKRKLPESTNCIPVVCDLNEIYKLKEMLPTGEADVFYHFAWAGSSGQARADSRLQLKNVQCSIDCLLIAKQLGCTRFVNAGSIMERETIAATYTQGNKPGVGYIYGSGKVATHAMCKAIAASLDIDLLCGVITNAYGVGERSCRLINSTIQKCIHGIAPRFTSGIQNYDFVYIDDVARAFRLIGEKGIPFNEYVIGSGAARPLKEFLLEMKATIAPNLNFIFGDVPFSGINLPLSSFDCSKTKLDTGFQAQIDFSQGCRRTYNWWRKELERERNDSKL